MNWGKGITIGIGLFMLFILSFVYRAFQNDSELVMDDYYEQEANFEDKKQGKHNYKTLGVDIQVMKEEGGICFYFPEQIQPKTEGSISFYRPNSKSMDRSFSLEVGSDQRQCLAYENFYEGYYDITVSWNSSEKSYIFEDNIQF